MEKDQADWRRLHACRHKHTQRLRSKKLYEKKKGRRQGESAAICMK